MKMETGYFSRLKKLIGGKSLALIIGAALLLEVTAGFQFHYVREKISSELETQATNELKAKSIAIRNLLSSAEVAVKNHVWDAQRLIEHPDSMFGVAKRLVEQNPGVVGSSISFIPDYYPSKGFWFEPYAVRRPDGTVETMQLGSAQHDYTKMEFYEAPVKKNRPHWSNPYLDNDGAKMRLTTYSYPVRDRNGKTVAIMDVDLSLEGIDSLLSVSYLFPSSYHILISRNGELMDYPDSTRELHATLREALATWKDPAMKEIVEDIIAGKQGKGIATDNEGNKSHIFYSKVGDEADWSLAVFYSDKEIYATLDNMRDKLIWLQIVGLLFLAFIIFRTIRNFNRLQKVTTEKERMDSELNIARKIQLGMLPAPENENLLGGRVNIEGSLVAAKEVGGDLYDYYTRNGRLYFCIGDVSGKGVPAALLMAMVRSMFRTVSATGSSPGAILSSINGYVLESDSSDMFVTMFVGILDSESGVLSYCNAGHDAPFIITEDKIEPLPVFSNLPIGVIEDFDYRNQQTSLPGDCMMFLYTDGLTEAMDSSHNQFGEQRVMEVLKSIKKNYADVSPDELLTAMSDSVKDFVGNAEQSDDLTMLAVRYSSQQKTRHMIELRNDISEIPRLNEFIEKQAEAAGLDKEKASELKLAAEEAVVNCINYAFPPDKYGNVLVETFIDNDGITLRISDEGPEFDPTTVAEPDLSLDEDEREIGGLGIHLIRQLTNSLEYIRENGKNILILKKNK